MELFVTALIVVALLLGSLYLIYLRNKNGKPVKTALISNISTFFLFLVGACVLGMSTAAGAAGETASVVTDASVGYGLGLIAAALATGLSGIGGGIAVAAAASAALGAISENEKMFGKSLIFVALAEGIALYGLVISFQILGMLG